MPATSHPLRKALETNSTASAFTAKIPVAALPTNVGFFNLFDGQYGVGSDGRVPKFLFVQPFGGNANNDTSSMRVWGWSHDVGRGSLWVPHLLVELAVTLGNIDASAIAANMLLADTLVATYSGTDEKSLGTTLISPANDLPASALVHLRGCQYIEFDFSINSGLGDAMNAFWRAVDDR